MDSKIICLNLLPFFVSSLIFGRDVLNQNCKKLIVICISRTLLHFFPDNLPLMPCFSTFLRSTLTLTRINLSIIFCSLGSNSSNYPTTSPNFFAIDFDLNWKGASYTPTPTHPEVHPHSRWLLASIDPL